MAPFDVLRRIIGDSPSIRDVRARILTIAPKPVPVLIIGETGTGKEICAQAIAALSGQQPFVPVNCAAFPEGLIDSELFGYERGAFTGATHNHAGVVAQADGGILFLDELADVSATAQAKLLRALESGEYRPLGGSRTRRAEFRTLAAVNGDPQEFIDADRLRADLVFRLGAIRITLPPLRERRMDIPLLAEAFLERYRARAGTGPSGIADASYGLLQEQVWKGNIRELKNTIEGSAALAGSARLIQPQHLKEVLMAPLDNGGYDAVLTLRETVRRAEIAAVEEAIRRAAGDLETAASMLGVSLATLYRKLPPNWSRNRRQKRRRMRSAEEGSSEPPSASEA